MTEHHSIPSVISPDSRILILGSFPSVRSREEGFFYAHPQNRFWRMLAAAKDEPVPLSVEEKLAFLRRWGIALWDVIASCEIRGSSDTSIRRVTPNPIQELLKKAPIERILANGRTAWQLYCRHVFPKTKREAICLPSTSAANAACSLDDLICAWSAFL